MFAYTDKPEVDRVIGELEAEFEPADDRTERFIKRRPDLILGGLLAIMAFVTRAWNISGYPAWFTDEGVYVSQAWAVQYQGALAPYTYWYDHPPLGWVQMALYSMLTGSLERHDGSTILAGREFMIFLAMATTVLIYVLARRLGLRRPFAVMAGLLYVLSPLAVSFSRLVLLDNIAIVWVLAAMVLALSPTRRLSAVVLSGLCLAIATLSKETALLALPAVAFLVWRHYRDSGNKGKAYIVFGSAAGLICVLYPLYAALKGELLPGPGHVSLWQGQVMFQLSSREGSGYIWDSSSDAWKLVDNAWLGLDTWLPLLGVAGLLAVPFIRKLWAPGIALAVQVALLFKGGYLPYPFIIGMLPFMALIVAGVADAWWPSAVMVRGRQYVRVFIRTTAVVVVLVATYLVVGPPGWQDRLHMEMTAQETSSQQEAIDWIGQNLPHDARLVSEGELWLDLRERGFSTPEVVWTYKIDTDPAVKEDYGNTDGLDYLVLNQATIDAGTGVYPTLGTAIADSTTLATFGNGDQAIVVLQVNHTP